LTRVYSLPKNKEDTIATVSKAKAKSTKAAPKRARGKAGAQAEELEDDEDDSVEDIVLEAKEAVDLTEDDATAAPDEAKEELPTGTIELPKDLMVLTDDEDDIPVQNLTISGATADPVKDYLKQIGKVALLNAELEVELAKRIEAGLFAEEKLGTASKLTPAERRDLNWVVKDGQRAKSHLLEANLASWCRSQSAIRVEACNSWT